MTMISKNNLLCSIGAMCSLVTSHSFCLTFVYHDVIFKQKRIYVSDYINYYVDHYSNVKDKCPKRASN